MKSPFYEIEQILLYRRNPQIGGALDEVGMVGDSVKKIKVYFSLHMLFIPPSRDVENQSFTKLSVDKRL